VTHRTQPLIGDRTPHRAAIPLADRLKGRSLQDSRADSPVWFPWLLYAGQTSDSALDRIQRSGHSSAMKTSNFEVVGERPPFMPPSCLTQDAQSSCSCPRPLARSGLGLTSEECVDICIRSESKPFHPRMSPSIVHGNAVSTDVFGVFDPGPANDVDLRVPSIEVRQRFPISIPESLTSQCSADCTEDHPAHDDRTRQIEPYDCVRPFPDALLNGLIVGSSRSAVGRCSPGDPLIGIHQ
jgi:hypothetical protein